jgi:hypothetical protein
MSKRKMIITYVSLVGVPLLGLIGILHGGRALRAPLSVAGNWNLEADVASWAGQPCGDLLSGLKQPAFDISQSGTMVVLALNNPQATALTGTIRGTTLTAGADEPANGAGQCSGSRAVHIDGLLKEDGAQRTLTGTLKLNTCATCAVIAFEAVRRAPAKKGGK